MVGLAGNYIFQAANEPFRSLQYSLNGVNFELAEGTTAYTTI